MTAKEIKMVIAKVNDLESSDEILRRADQPYKIVVGNYGISLTAISGTELHTSITAAIQKERDNIESNLEKIKAEDGFEWN